MSDCGFGLSSRPIRCTRKCEKWRKSGKKQLKGACSHVTCNVISTAGCFLEILSIWRHDYCKFANFWLFLQLLPSEASLCCFKYDSDCNSYCFSKSQTNFIQKWLWLFIKLNFTITNGANHALQWSFPSANKKITIPSASIRALKISCPIGRFALISGAL